MFKKHKFLGFLAGLITIVSAFYLINDVSDDLVTTVLEKLKETPPTVNQTPPSVSEVPPFSLESPSENPPIVAGQSTSEYEIEAYFDDALTHIENDKLDKAYALYKEIPPSHEKAQLLSEKIIEGYYELALNRSDRGHFDEAKKWIERGLGLDANHEKLGALKIKLAQEEEIRKLVENDYQQAARKNNRGEYQESMALIQHGLSLNPSHEKLRALSEKVELALKKRQQIESFYQLALAKVNKKAYEAAMVWIDKGLSLDRSHKKLQALKKQISQTQDIYSPTQDIYTNSIGMKFKLIKAGKFKMGSENGDSDEKPVHWVEITKDFYMGVYEVTVGQYKKYVDDKGGHFDQGCNKQGDKAAVSCVSWKDAQGFISWLNNKEGGSHYKLPTEAQWEYAARAGTTTEYSFGDDSSLLGDYAWYSGNRKGYYAYIVGQKKPNPWGLYDMHGNVWEWVQDWYDANYYSSPPPRRDPKGAGAGQDRVLRGGGWNLGASNCRSAFRAGGSPASRFYSLGFRLLIKYPVALGFFTLLLLSVLLLTFVFYVFTIRKNLAS
ncbi:MAG: SUMF1/EgtB/PvdO family nonheme iron enzyme [Pseudomonadota bacterium]